MIVHLIKKFDRHCILYSAGIGIVLNMLYGPKVEIVLSAFYCGVLGGGGWYVLKAFYITADNIAHWPKDKPFFSDGTITEYDRNFSRAVGDATAKAVAKEMKRHD